MSKMQSNNMVKLNIGFALGVFMERFIHENIIDSLHLNKTYSRFEQVNM